MKKYLFSFSALILFFFSQAQNSSYDQIHLHNGQTMQVHVISIGDRLITFINPDKPVEHTIGKLAVEKIEYGNGKTENISDKIEVNGKKDWEKVLILYDADAVAGLKKGDEIYGKTPYYSVSNISKNQTEDKSIKNLKKAAAENYSAPIVLIISDQLTYKKGIIYNY